MHDVFREKNKDLMEFTWWGYRPTDMFEKNQGYRLDTFLANDISNKYIKDCFVEREMRKQERPSDHVPVSIIIE
jgi:exodeoxyribonuclease-3